MVKWKKEGTRYRLHAAAKKRERRARPTDTSTFPRISRNIETTPIRRRLSSRFLHRASMFPDPRRIS